MAYELLSREHPDFDLASLPPIPDNWQDISWRNDSCPSFEAPNGCRIFVDYADLERREFPEIARFSARGPDSSDGTGDEIAFGEDWDAILKAVAEFDADGLERFRKSGRDVIDLGVEIPGQDLEGQSGRMYQGGAYLMLQVDGQWSLILGNEEYWEPRETLEERLYAWAKSEGFFEQPAEVGQIS